MNCIATSHVKVVNGCNVSLHFEVVEKSHRIACQQKHWCICFWLFQIHQTLCFVGFLQLNCHFSRDRLWVHSQKWCGNKKAVKTTPEESSPMSVDLIRLLTIVPTLLDRGSLYEWSISGNRHNHDMTSALSLLPNHTSGILSYGELRDGKGCFLLFEIACWLMKVQDSSLVRSRFWQHLRHIRLNCSSNRRICSRHVNTNFHPTTAAELSPAIWHKL